MKTAVRIQALLVGLLLSVSALAQTPTEKLDSSARAALDQLYASAPGAKALGERAKAVLVFPDVTKAAFVLGVQTGEGVLLRDGKVAGHYSIGGIQAGLEAGAATKTHSK